LLSFGTVLRDGETFSSPRVLDAIGPAIAVIYHGAYQAGGAEAVDQLPGGAAWRAEIERYPEAVRHLYVHEGHIYELTDRDRRHRGADRADRARQREGRRPRGRRRAPRIRELFPDDARAADRSVEGDRRGLSGAARRGRRGHLARDGRADVAREGGPGADGPH